MRTTHLIKRLLQTSAIVAVGMNSAYAQDSATDAAEGAKSKRDTIVVTGSRIKNDAYSSGAPIEILTIEEAQLEGIADVGSLLQTATIASGSPQVTAATSAQFVQNGGVGSTTVSLRGLGANRTLSLINGRRAGPSGTRGSVSSFDVNSIPLLALERVEILKDGASSIYGSDAVAGVVNYITNRSDDKSVDFFTTIPEQGGGELFRASGTWGETFDKGRIRLTADYTLQKEMTRGDRDYYDCAESYVLPTDGSAGLADVIDPRTGEAQCIDLLWGHVWIYDYAAGNVPSTFPALAQYDYDGALAANGLSPYPNQGGNGGFNISVPNSWFPVYYDQNDIAGLADWAGITVGTEARGLTNGDHPFQDRQSLVPEIERITLMADGEYELNSSVKAYGEALYNRRTTKQNSYRQFWTYVFGETGAVFGAGPNSLPTAQGWSGNAQWYSPTAITEFSDTIVEIDYLRFVGGLTGDFGSFGGEKLASWTWDASVQYSDSSGSYTEDQIRNDSIQDNWFGTSSCVGTLSSVAGLPCVDVPWFDPQFLAGNIDPASKEFLFTRETGNTDYSVLSFEAYAAGDLFSLPAGSVAGAFGILVQEDKINDTPSDIVQSGNAWGTSTAGITAGKTLNKAIYGELFIPLVKDVPMFESLDLKLSGRFTDIEATPADSTLGAPRSFSSETYKVGVNWQVIPSLRLRATVGTSFRAPALFELFLANQTSSLSLRGADPCVQWGTELANGNINQNTADNCAADGVPNNFTGGAITSTIITGGGFSVLEAETSDNLTLGFVWTPEFANLKVAFDYFRIEVNGQVSQLGAVNILNGCYNSEEFSTETLCELITRNPPGPDAFRINTLEDSFININQQFNEGLDLNVRYVHETPVGRLIVDADATYQLEDFTRLLASSGLIDTNGESGNPKLVAGLTFTLETEKDWTFVWNMDYIGQTSNVDRFTRLGGRQTLYGVPVQYKLNTEAVVYHTFSATKDITDKLRVTVGIRNAFGEEPPRISVGGQGNGQGNRVGSTDFSSNFDTIGRRFFFNLTNTF
ncbi:MAG: TonB-dependent receptor [Robiginitomaculum sp.]|nr:MAG: TonB-dependent receptor [Robiginitomaculum sp.]